jgi:DNA-binding transcriptional regulator YhcF (GntR family)
MGKLDLYANFMYEQISLNRLMFAISLEHSGKGRSVPSKKYLAEGKRINSFTYKNMTKHQYHIERKKVYKRIEEIKYLHSYKNNLNSYFLESSFYKDNHNLSEMVINELLRINEFIKKHKP